MEQLQKDQAIAPKAVDEVEKKIEELLSRPKDQWYEHASLEAAQHLRDQMGAALQELGTQYGMTLPKGASDAVIQAAKKLVQKHGAETLGQVVKLHFRTTLSVLGSNG